MAGEMGQVQSKSENVISLRSDALKSPITIPIWERHRDYDTAIIFRHILESNQRPFSRSFHSNLK